MTDWRPDNHDVTKPTVLERLRDKTPSGLLLLGSLALSVLLAEGISRCLTEPIRGVSWYHYDTRFGFRHRANADTTTNTWGDGEMWRFYTNAHGFRGGPWAFEESADRKRVLTMGDSFTFGNAVPAESAYSRVANALLEEAGGKGGRRWEVLNLGVSAWGPSNALAWLESEGAELQASCLIYGFFVGNDVMDNDVYSLYRLEAGRLAAGGGVSNEGRAGRIRRWVRRFPFYDFLLERSQLFNLVRNAGMRSAMRGDATHQRMSRYQGVSAEEFEEALTLNRAVLDRLNDLSRTRFGGFGLIIVPMRGPLATEPDAEPAFPTWIAERSRQDVLAWASDGGVPVLDLYDELPRDPGEVARLYFEKDFHLNEYGNRKVGEIFAREMTRLCARARSAPAP